MQPIQMYLSETSVVLTLYFIAFFIALNLNENLNILIKNLPS